MKEQTPKKSSGGSTFLLILIFMIGLSLLLYPTVADYWNSFHQSHAITHYSETVAKIDPDRYRDVWESAIEYNANILQRRNAFVLDEDEEQRYYSELDLNDTGIMGYIDIPSLDVELPIYHGTEDTVLQVAVGHLDWTSLPTGGESTHCVLSGHRGLPSAKLFTNLDRLREGDIFMLRVLDEILTYEVDRILIVEPEDVSELRIIENEDLCTLVTCTPYGINTHRLLVRGHRIETAAEAAAIRVTADAIEIEPLLVAVALAIPMLILLIIIVLIRDAKRKR